MEHREKQGMRASLATQEWLTDAIRFSKSPITRPDPGSKPTISNTLFSTLIARGICGDRKSPDKPITRPSQRNKPESGFGQEEGLEKKFV
jgi:hypothetical protein